MTDPEKKEIPIEDAGAAGEAHGEAHEKIPAAPAKKKAAALLSAEVVTPTSGPSVSTVDRSDQKGAGLPKDGQALVAVALDVLEKDFNSPDSKVKQSLFLQGLYSGLKLYNNLFAFTLTPGDFMASVDALNPLDAFGEDEMKKIWEKRLKVRYVELCKKIENARTLKERSEFANEASLIEKRLAKLKGIDITDREALGKFRKELREEFNVYLKSDTSPLVKAELAKFAKNKEADSYISTYFVLKQLDALPATKEGEKIEDVCDPRKLMSKLMHADYDDHGNKSRQNLFTKVDNQVQVMDLQQSSNLPAGTVVFFEKFLPDESKILMCGIAGMDGKIRYQTGEGEKGKLEELTTFSPQISKSIASLTKTFNGLKAGGKIPDFDATDQLKSSLSDVLSGQSSGIQFVGAFIPNSELGVSKNDKEHGEESQYMVGGKKDEKEEVVENKPGSLDKALDAAETERATAERANAEKLATPEPSPEAAPEPPEVEAPEKPKEQTKG